MPAKSHTRGDAIRSEFAGDPDMQDLILAFVNDPPRRIARIQADMASADHEAVRRLAHQLRGAASGYGFRAISAAAAELERRAEAANAIGALRRQFRELADLCWRATAASRGT